MAREDQLNRITVAHEQLPGMFFCHPEREGDIQKVSLRIPVSVPDSANLMNAADTAAWR